MEEPIEERFEVSLEKFKTVLEEHDLLGYVWDFNLWHNHKAFYSFIRGDIEYTLSFSCDFFLCIESGSKIVEREGLGNVELVIDDMDKGMCRVYKLKA